MGKFDFDSGLLVKFNYGIAVCVILLGFIASYVSYQRSNVPQVVAEKTARPMPTSTPKKIPDSVFASNIGDWKYECKLSLEGMEQCSALRRVLWEDGKSEALLAVMSMAGQGNARTPRLKLVTPLGTFLPAGITMTIDKQDPFLVPFQACAEEGCFVNLDLAPDVVAAMKTGALMVVEYMTPEQKIATVKIPLAGVDDVLKRIAK